MSEDWPYEPKDEQYIKNLQSMFMNQSSNILFLSELFRSDQLKNKMARYDIYSQCFQQTEDRVAPWHECSADQ